MPYRPHPILQQSFAIIDREIGDHGLPPEEYAIVRRVIHSTADFDFQHLIHVSAGAIEQAITALLHQAPIVTDVTMVTQGINRLVQETFGNPVITAVMHGENPPPGQTRTEAGMRRCYEQHPTAIYVIGNAPTALLALCEQIQRQRQTPIFADRLLARNCQVPALIIGAPVGFVGVEAAKTALAQLPIPQIRIEGRKGGSATAAAILNALLVLAGQCQEARVTLA